MTQPLDIDTSRVTDMKHMFDGAAGFDQQVGGFDTGRVTDMSALFKGASTFNGGAGNQEHVMKLPGVQAAPPARQYTRARVPSLAPARRITLQPCTSAALPSRAGRHPRDEPVRHGRNPHHGLPRVRAAPAAVVLRPLRAERSRVDALVRP